MNLKTFYVLFYKHRFQKANFLRKIYILLIIPFKYVINLFYLPSKKNLDYFSKENAYLFTKDINFLFEYFNSDKGNFYINQYTHPSKKNNKKIVAHGYSKYYENIFKPLKDNHMNILEIGSFYGNASAALYFYFKNSRIFGADINPDMFIYSSKRIKSFYVNSSSLESIKENIIKKNIHFKIIIEDASHMLKDQIISLFYLFPLIESGGIFIIEELDFPESRVDMRLDQEFPDLKTILKDIINKRDFNSIYINDYSKKYFLSNYESIEILKGNFNQLAIIKKK